MAYKRFVACGCSHGHLADPKALKAVLSFCEKWKPNTRIHLGDYIDTAAFRSGARGTEDETISLESDLAAGIQFLRNYRPDVLLNGNHDIRLWDNLDHHNAIISECARAIIRQIEFSLPKKCQFIKTYDIRSSYVTLGDTIFAHGWFYNEMALRDHAEHFGRCVIAHLHKVGQAPGRRVDSPTGYCVGMLGDPALFTYAQRKRAISQWSQGFSWGEYNEKECIVYLCERAKDGSWRLPL